MAVVSSRQGLIDHCLRRLGYPVIEINVDDDQIEDRVDDALTVLSRVSRLMQHQDIHIMFISLHKTI
jgi:hypothetical protein